MSTSRHAPSHQEVEVATTEPLERRRVSSDSTARSVDDAAISGPLNTTEQRRTSFDSTAGKDDDATNMQNPNTGGRRRPCSDLANGPAVLSIGPSIWSGPPGNSINPRVKTHMPIMGPTAARPDSGNDKVERQEQGPEAASLVQDWCKEGGAQDIRKDGQTTEEQGIYEKGNLANAAKGERQYKESTFYQKEGTCRESPEEGEKSTVIIDDDVAEVQILNLGKSREVHTNVGKDSRGMGLSIHTPHNHNGVSSNSPQSYTNEPSSTWRVYSRMRRCQKKQHLGSLNESTNETDSNKNTDQATTTREESGYQGS